MTVDHPTLGPATAILDDRARTRRSIAIAAVTAAVGMLGIVMGIGDWTNGDEVGLVFILTGLILILYGLNQARVGAARMLRPVRLVVAQGGFEFAAGPGPIAWDEVAAVSYDEVPPRETEPNALRARVRAPDEFARRHSFTERARLRLQDRDGWIAIGGGMAMPLEQVLAMMKDRLDESRAGRRSAPARSRGARRVSRH